MNEKTVKKARFLSILGLMKTLFSTIAAIVLFAAPVLGQNGEGESDAERTIPAIGELISFQVIFLVVLTLVVTWFLSGFLTRILNNLSERWNNYRLFIKRLTPVVRVSLWSVSLYFIIAGIIQPPVETIITISASLGIAVGFASQDILKNIFGGIMIILDRPFQVGDKIDIGGHYGEVTEIGLRSVRIVTDDDSEVTIPNAELTNKAVSNSNSGALDCMVVAEIFLPKEGQVMRDLIEIGRRAAVTSPYVFMKKPVSVHVYDTTVGPRNYLKLRVRAYVFDVRYEFQLRSDMTERIFNELKRRNIAIA